MSVRLVYFGNNSVFEIVKDVLCLSHAGLPSINAVYIFLVFKIHWSKALYYAGWCILLLMFLLFFRNIKIAKIKFSSHWKQMMFVLCAKREKPYSKCHPANVTDYDFLGCL